MADSSQSKPEKLAAMTNSMLEEGIGNEQLLEIQKLPNHDHSLVHDEAILTFVEDTEKRLNELEMLLNKPVAEYENIDSICYTLKGSSASIGSQNLLSAVDLFANSCKEREQNLQKCQEALDAVNKEFALLQSKLKTMTKLIPHPFYYVCV